MPSHWLFKIPVSQTNNVYHFSNPVNRTKETRNNNGLEEKEMKRIMRFVHFCQPDNHNFVCGFTFDDICKNGTFFWQQKTSFFALCTFTTHNQCFWIQSFECKLHWKLFSRLKLTLFTRIIYPKQFLFNTKDCVGLFIENNLPKTIWVAWLKMSHQKTGWSEQSVACIL